VRSYDVIRADLGSANEERIMNRGMARAALAAVALVMMAAVCGFAVSARAQGPADVKPKQAASQRKGASAAAGQGAIASRYAVAEGVRLHYLVAGEKTRPAVVLLHGYTQTSRMWRPLMPQLAEKFFVIAPDLPGIGDSGIPTGGLDMKNAAIRVHALVKSLGVDKAEVVGHDIGLMVAYGYAAQFPSETTKLVLMDAFLPGVQGWESVYDSPDFWHFRFYGETPEELVKGREQIYFAYFWNDLAADKDRSLSGADRDAYVEAYSRPGRMKAGWAYFAGFQQTAKDFAELAQKKLTIPVLSIAGDKASAGVLGDQAKLVANDAQVVVLKDTGHWLMEESPKETMEALVGFL
jgi:pimeloyl-ACP methyl ester carboxylesterase